MNDWQPLTPACRPQPGLPAVVLFHGVPTCATCEISDDPDDAGLILSSDEEGLSWNVDLDGELPSHFFQLTALPAPRPVKVDA